MALKVSGRKLQALREAKTRNASVTWKELLLSDVIDGVDAWGGRVFSGARFFENENAVGEEGRFTSEDPARDGANWYTYCANNPLTYVDPTGLEITYDPSGARSNYDPKTGVVTYVADPYMSASEAALLNAQNKASGGQYEDKSMPAFVPTPVDPQALQIEITASRIALAYPGDNTCTTVLLDTGNELGYDMTPFNGMDADAIHTKLAEMSKDPTSGATKVTAAGSQATANKGAFVIDAREKYPDPDDATVEHAGHVAITVYDLNRRTITDKGKGTDSPRVIGGGITTEQRIEWGVKVEDASWAFSFGKTTLRPDYYVYEKKRK